MVEGINDAAGQVMTEKMFMFRVARVRMESWREAELQY